MKLNTSQASDESVNQPTVVSYDFESLHPSESALSYLNGDLDLVYDAKRHDWTPLEHWNFLTQGRNTTEVKNVSSELQEKFVVAKWCQLQTLKHPDRVLSSRMVQRLKPQEGFGTPPDCACKDIKTRTLSIYTCTHARRNPSRFSSFG